MTQSTTAALTVTIGIDLGDRKSHVCVLDADGQVVEESRIATTPKTLRARFEGLAALTQAKRKMLASLLRRHRDSRVLVFTPDKDAAYQIAREHLIMPITADIHRREREEMMAAFREGQIRALVSARVLNEGFDVPAADVGIVVGGALGEREYTQRVGRLFRPGNGKNALIYELVTRGTVEVPQSRRRKRGLQESCPCPL